MKLKIPAKTKWADIVGYSRAVKTGNLIHISGTAAVDNNGNIIAPGNAFEQTKFIIQKIRDVLNECGSSLNDVVRTRIYVTDISDWEAVGKAHSEFFKDIKPVTSMVQVAGLIDKDMVVEIEAEAIIESEKSKLEV